jgi:hypothetical protein
LRLYEDNPLVNHSYFAEYTANDSLSAGVLFDENLMGRVTLSANNPGTQIIYVRAYNDQDLTEDAIDFQISAVFVPQFLSANFIAYPQGYLSPAHPKYRNSKDYVSQNVYLQELQLSGIGNAFYGEGHTDSLALSTNTLLAGCSANWTVGPYNLTTSSSTTSILISSQSNVASVYPIGLQVFNNTFIQDGPVVAYFEQLSGQPSFYPFYSSSLTVDGLENPANQTFHKSLSVLKYPENSQDGYYLTTNSFTSGDSIILPFDSSPQLFIGSLQAPDYISPSSKYYSPIFVQKYNGSEWNINATANPAGINPDWSLTTTRLSSAKNLKFQLSYSDQYNIDNTLLKASAGYPTTLNLVVSAYRNISIPVYGGSDIYGGSWKPREQFISLATTATITPLPITYLYTANYYNLTGTNVKVTNVWSNLSELASSSSTTILYNSLSSIPLNDGQSDSFYFGANDIGTIDLSAVTTFVDANLSAYTKMYHAPGILEIIDSYDDVETNHFFSETSPLTISQNNVPRLSPNEWVTSDNVNSLIDKFSKAIDELDQYTSLYTLSSTKFTGRLEQVNILDGYTNYPILTSFTLPDGSIVTYNKSIPVLTLGTTLSSLSSMVTFNSNPSSTVTFPVFLDNYIPNVPGFVYTWVTPFINPSAYYNWTVPSSSTNLYYTGFVVLPNSEKIVVSYQNLINLIDNTYSTRVTDSAVTIDEIFQFQNIQSMQTTSKDFIVVLDSVLPRVSVYNIVKNKFNLFTTWAKYGHANSKSGLNKPQDLHIDQQDLIWIADTGNNCVKKYTLSGKNLLVITHEYLNSYAPLSVCVDSQQLVHILTSVGVFVFDSNGNYVFRYSLPTGVSGATKINTSYNRECIYITYSTGVVKYFRTGVFYQNLISDIALSDGTILQGFNTIFQDKYRNAYFSVKDQIVRAADLMKLNRHRAQTINNLLWSLEEMYVHKEEYIQPWVYLKSFHRLWDNIEVFRNSLFYNETGAGSYVPPTYSKSDLVIGQNEIVTNAVINRICAQLWTNLRSVISYFDISVS